MTYAEQIEALEKDVADTMARIQTLESGLFLLETELAEMKEALNHRHGPETNP